MAIIFLEDFESLPYFPLTGSAINKVRGIENCNDRDVEHGTAYDWTLKRITSPVYEGTQSCQIEVHDCGDPPDPALLVGGVQRVRSEVAIIDNETDSRFTPGGMWYSFNIYFPTAGMGNDLNSDETHSQWWLDGGNDTLIRCMNGRWGFEIIPASGSGVVRYDLFGAPGAAPTASESTFKTTFTPIPKDEWHTFVFHFIHSTTGSGLVEIWRNGTLIQTLNQRNMHVSRYPKWKVGIYKSDYTAHPGDSDQPVRTLYFDNIRVGDEDTVYADMVSGGGAPSNIPPVANAGSNQTITLPTDTGTLNGSGSSDSDGTITNYAWSQVSGPNTAGITSPSSVSTGITGLIAGTYVFELEVTDNDSATDTDQVSILVNPIGYPLADAGTDQVIDLPTNTATLDGTSSTDPDGTITGYAWTKLSGPASGSITSPGSATTGLTGLVAGTYVFRLTVTDNDSNTDTDDVVITVNPANVPPTSNAGSNQSVTLPASSVTLNGSASADADGTIDGYEWERVSGPNNPTIVSPFNASTNVTGLIEGVYVFRLTVTDNDDVEGTDDVTVTVNGEPDPPPEPEPEPEPDPVYVPSNWHQSIINRVNCC